MTMVVTIDGPAGSGKSTIARRLAEALGWRLLDTGAMFRAVTLAAMREGLNLSDRDAVGELAERCQVDFPPGQVVLNGEDVTYPIRSAEVTRASRPIADNPRVRTRLVQWQRTFADEYPTITEGRDQGTVVFPDAPCKFFLTASLEERARRRHADFRTRGEEMALDVVLSEIRERDAQDRARAIAPLKAADDAIVVDTSALSPDEVLDRLLKEVRARIPATTGATGLSSENRS